MEKLAAKRYAKALFEIGEEKGIRKELRENAKWLENVFREHTELVRFFLEPDRKEAEKEQVLEAVFRKKTEETLFSFLRLLVRKKQIDLVTEIMEQVQEVIREKDKEEKVKITTSYALSREEKEEIEQKLRRQFHGNKIEIHYCVDSAIIGGMIVQSKDTVYDDSILNKLQMLRENLTEAVERRE